MILLSLETSSSVGSLGVFSLKKEPEWIEETLFYDSWSSEKFRHSEKVTPLLKDIFAKIDKKKIDGFCVSCGPGSFTGIRVAINTIRSLAYSLEKPIYPLNSLEVLALPCSKEKNVVTLMKAQKNQFYFSSFSNGKMISASQAITLSALEKKIQSPCVCVGDACCDESFSKKLKKNFLKKSEYSNFPRAKEMVCKVIEDKIQPISWEQLNPQYIKLSSAEEKLKNISYD